ncbi:MAG: glycyl radical protein [Candidatus Abyssobacteria bacterium SURF_17]|uniref:Glycyl radical protein n=1 Tax=Candidatus Abyssobacteria bacterium SURF_17 TaxID=2093361 RepID=A0A419F9G3_9BACT|nr:MAG: glycyl radical protein [Candidatus Abyssubacteria bacterium SURF_17]
MAQVAELARPLLSPQEERIERGEPIGLVSEEAQRKRARIHRMLAGFRDKPIRMNLERAHLLTESFKQTEGQPVIVRWGKALAHILRNISIHIGEDELIVGSAGPPGRYAIFFPELEEKFFTQEARPSEPDDSLVLTEEDVQVINEELKPYWEGKQYHGAFINALPDDTRRILELYCIIAPTATARSSLAWNHDYEKVLKRGIKGIKAEAEEKLASLDPVNPKDRVEKEPFLQAVILTCDAIVEFAHRYAKLARSMAKKEKDAKRKKELLEIAEVCEWVPENPARTFREAVQSQWLIQTVSRLEQRIGGTVGNGRIDQFFYPYYKKDIEEGRLTKDEALELVECMWIGMAQNVEIYTAPGSLSFTDGYAHWEATTVGGVDKDGKDATNELSYLLLQSKKEFPLNYPDLAARIHSQTPEPFLHAIAETIKEGTGFPKLFFDEEIIPLFLSKGGTVEEANDYCICGCTEAKMINHDAVSTGCAWTNLGAIVEMTLNDGKLKLFGDQQIGVSTGNPRQFKSYDDLWHAFCWQAENVMKHTFTQQYVADTLKAKFIAAPMCSMLHDLCMKECKDIHDGPIDGALYLGFIDTLGFATAIDSLAAVKRLVFDDKKLTMAELLDALDANFEGKEAVRQMCLNAPKYGNNDPYADSIGRNIEAFFVKLTRKYKSAFGGELDIRYVTITAHVPFGAVLGATPDGRKAGEPIAEGVSPSQGADKKGPTASLVSIANTKASGYKERAARLLNMKLSPSAVAGPEGTRKLMSLIRTACDLKMWHLQFNIINKETLIAAQKDPEKYRNLLVRVAGYSAYFVDLTPQLQDEIIKRTEHAF